jgi:hypothetical protein
VPVGPIESIGGRPSIFIQDGIFYTADIYPSGATLQKKKWGSVPKPQPKFAGVIGANIYLTDPPKTSEQKAAGSPVQDTTALTEAAVGVRDQLASQIQALVDANDARVDEDLVVAPRVLMLWRLNGRDVSLNLRKEAGVTYEIYITNEPLCQDDTIDAPFSHDELSEYYKILPLCPQGEQFILKTPPPNRGSLRTPCMSVLLNQ